MTGYLVRRFVADPDRSHRRKRAFVETFVFETALAGFAVTWTADAALAWRFPAAYLAHAVRRILLACSGGGAMVAVVKAPSGAAQTHRVVAEVNGAPPRHKAAPSAPSTPARVRIIREL